MQNVPEKKLKLAIQFFGHLRTYKSCLPSIKKNLLNYYDCDIFMHTWSTIDHNTKTWHNYKPKQGEVDVKTLEAELASKLGNVKGVLVETQNPQPLGEIHSRTRFNRPCKSMSIFGISSMLHSMAASNQLREEYMQLHKIQYDFVFCIRPDILLKTPIQLAKLTDFLNNMAMERAFFTLGKPLYVFVEGLRHMVMTDSFFFAKPAVISHVLNNRRQMLTGLKDGITIDNPPEYEFIKIVKKLEYVPYYTTMQYGNDFEILRHASSQSMRKRLIRLRLTDRFLHVYFLPRLARQICRLRFDICDWYQVDICIGNYNNDKL